MNIAKATILTMVIALAMIGTLGFAAATQTSVTLEEKDSSWNIVGNGYNATIVYGDVGSKFVWSASGTAKQVDTEYSLIYYADKPDRFVNWGGDNPGALIGAFTTDGSGDFDASGSINLNMNLPCSPDTNGNASETNYTATDGYANANGAKLWMVPSVDYTAPALTAWNPDEYLFETDLITYDDCDDFYEGEPATATFAIEDALVGEPMDITITNATNVGSVKVVLNYNASAITLSDVVDGDMDVTYSNDVSGQVTIGAYQGASDGLNGDFTLAGLNFTPISDGTYDFQLYVATYKDATPCVRAMPFDFADDIGVMYLNGDVNDDGIVDMSDVMYLAKHVLVISGFEDIIELASDVNGDGDIDMDDVTYLAMHIVGASGWEYLL